MSKTIRDRARPMDPGSAALPVFLRRLRAPGECDADTVTAASRKMTIMRWCPPFGAYSSAIGRPALAPGLARLREWPELSQEFLQCISHSCRALPGRHAPVPAGRPAGACRDAGVPPAISGQALEILTRSVGFKTVEGEGRPRLRGLPEDRARRGRILTGPTSRSRRWARPRRWSRAIRARTRRRSRSSSPRIWTSSQRSARTGSAIRSRRSSKTDSCSAAARSTTSSASRRWSPRCSGSSRKGSSRVATSCSR